MPRRISIRLSLLTIILLAAFYAGARLAGPPVASARLAPDSEVAAISAITQPSKSCDNATPAISDTTNCTITLNDTVSTGTTVVDMVTNPGSATISNCGAPDGFWSCSFSGNTATFTCATTTCGGQRLVTTVSSPNTGSLDETVKVTPAGGSLQTFTFTGKATFQALTQPTKSCSPSTPAISNTTDCTITLNNTVFGGATVADSVTAPQGVTIVNCGAPDGFWSCGTNGAGTTTTFTCATSSCGAQRLVVTVTSPATGSLGESLQISLPNGGSQSFSYTGAFTGNAQFVAITQPAKACNPSNPAVSNNTDCTITLSNTVPGNTTIVDRITGPANATVANCGAPDGFYSCGFSGNTATFTCATTTCGGQRLVVTVNSPSTGALTESLTITLPNGGTQTFSYNTEATFGPLTFPTKSCDNATPAIGNTTNCTITLTNTVPQNTTVVDTVTAPGGATILSCSAPDGFFSCNANGGTTNSASFTCATSSCSNQRLVVTITSPNTGALGETVQVALPNGASQSFTYTGEATFGTLTKPNKSCDNATPALGDTTTCTITLSNTVPGNTTIVDRITGPANATVANCGAPDGFYSCGFSGNTATFTCATTTCGGQRLQVAVTSPNVGPLTETVTITPFGGGAEIFSYSGEATFAGLAKPAKSCSPTNPTAGTTSTTCTLTLSNSVPGGTTVADQITGPANATVANCGAPDGFYSCGFSGNTATFTCATTTCGGQRLQAAISSANPGLLKETVTVTLPNGGTQSFTYSGEADFFQPTVSADIQVTKTGPATATAGTIGTYTISVTNAGPNDATNITMNEAVTGPGTVQTLHTPTTTGSTVHSTQQNGNGFTAVLDLNAGVTQTFTVDVSFDAPGTVTNTASASSSDVQDPDTSNNSQAVTTTVSAAAGSVTLAATKSGPSSVTVGQQFNYTFAVSNSGSSAATGVVLSDPLPAGTTFVSAGFTNGVNSGNCFNTAGTVACNLGTIAAGGNASATITVTAPTVPGSLSNTASVSSNESAAVSSNTVTTQVNPPQADLAVTKTGAPNPVIVGQNETYTITVTNNGPSTAQSVVLTDNLPANATFVSVTPSSPTCTQNTSTIICNLGNMPASPAEGSQAIVTVVVTPTQPGTITDTASVTSNTADPNGNNNTANANTTVNPPPTADLAVTKSGPATASAGATLTYTITVTNNGPDTAVSPVLTDTVPAAATFVSATPAGANCSFNSGTNTITCNLSDIAKNGSTVVTVTETAPANPTTGQQLSDTASVSSQTNDNNSGNNSATFTTTLNSSADIGVTKSGPQPVFAGDNISYSIAVHNAGPSTAANVVLTDTIPTGTSFVSATPDNATSCANASGTVTCNLGNLTNGQTVNVTLVVGTSGSTPGSVDNTASVHTDTPDPNLNNNTSNTVTTTVNPSADVSITKTAPSSAAAGQNFDYTLTVTNNGPSTAQGVTATDTLPAGVTFVSATPAGANCTNSSGTVTCNLGNLTNGQTVTITITVKAPNNPPQGGSVSNSATVASGTHDSNSENNTSATVTTAITASADLGITKSAPQSVYAGDPIPYTITVTNNGPSTATSASVTDTLPAGTTFSSASPGCTNAAGTVTCTVGDVAVGTPVTVTITAGTSGTTPASVSNTASVSSPTPDPVSGNNTSAAAVTAVNPSANLSVSKTATAQAHAGDQIVYTIVVTNNGPSSASGVVLTDPLPSGTTFVSATPAGANCSNNSGTVTCNLGTLANTNSVTVTLTVATSGTTPSPVSNTATVNSSTHDTDTTNNSSTANTALTPSADISVSKSGPAVTVHVGDNISYTLTVSNAGPSTAQGVTLTDTIPSGTTFVSASPQSANCANNVGTVTCNLGAVTTSQPVTVTLVVGTSASTPSPVTNSASVSTTTFESNTNNNTSNTVSTPLAPSADLSIAKAGPATVTAGQNFSYTLTVHNAGPSTATSVNVSDTLPAGVTFVSASYTNTAGAQNGACTQSGGVVSCGIGSLPAGGADATATITVTAPAQGTVLSNSATVSSGTFDSNSQNNASNTVSTTVTATADVSITKAGPTTVAAGQGFSYTLTVHNAGPSDAAGVTVTDQLPVGATFVSSTPGSPTCSFTAGTRTVTCNLGTRTVGAADATVTINVTAPSQPTTLQNSATVSSTTADSNPGNNTSNTVTTTVTASADVSITKAGPATVPHGTNFSYTVTVHNAGPSDATSVSVTDHLPAGVTFVSSTPTTPTCNNVAGTVTCNLGTVTAGSDSVVTITVTAPSQQATLTNTASVSSPVDSTPNNNTSNTVTTQVTNPDLTITKSHSGNFITGQTGATYMITVSNVGQGPTSGTVTVIDTVPAGLTPTAAGGTGWGGGGTNSCGISGQVVTCTRSDALAGGQAYSPITLTVNVARNAPSSVTNQATVSGGGESNTANDTASDPTTITVQIPAVTGCTAAPAVLTPADGTLRTVNITLSVSGSAPATVTLLSVTSSDPITAADYPGFTPGNTYTVTPPGTATASGQLRAAVSSGGHARQYVLTFAVVVGGQQGSPCQATVQVRVR